ncbi:MAG: response regulator [Aliidongia sp.]
MREKLNILLVADQPAKLLSYETILAELDETLIKASSAHVALELLLKHEVAVILIEVCMPELDGFELAQKIRQHPRYQTTAIIFVSAVQVTDHDLVRGHERGAVDYVPMPVASNLLRAKVRVFAELYRKTKELERFNTELERRVAERTAELADANAALAQTNEDLERRVDERTREHAAALAQMHQLQKLDSLGQLTGGVAHDFNNLLMAIVGHLELVQRSLPTDNTRLQRLIEGAMQGAERGAILTKRMLAFARRQELKPEQTDVATLIGGMMEMLRRTLGPLIEIRTEFAEDLGVIRVDPNQFELALLNLALNARDAMPDSGTLTIAATVEATSRGPHVCIAVTDTGRGIEDNILNRATEPFFTTKELGEGTGLGLSMVDGLVIQSGGSMRMSSRVGVGTKVELLFPRNQPDMSTELAAAPALQAHPEQSYHVLLVDDDPLVSSSTAAMLEELGHTVIETSCVSEALDKLWSGVQVDCIITDQAMPGATGLSLANTVREFWPHTPVILASGYADLPENEVNDLPRLAKPYRLNTLSTVLTQVLGTKSAPHPAAVPVS